MSADGGGVSESLRVLLCANPDLNLIDGSSIWSQSVALLFAGLEHVTVDFMPKSEPKNHELFLPLRSKKNVRILSRRDARRSISRNPRLSHAQMADWAADLDQQEPYDFIVVRGREIVEHLQPHPSLLRKTWVYLTDIPQSVLDVTELDKPFLRDVADKAERIIVQSDSLRVVWESVAGDTLADKVWSLPPLLPDFVDDWISPSARGPIAAYSGKFSEDYKTADILALWPIITAEVVDARLEVVGDKFHHADPHYQERLEIALQNTHGVSWTQRLPRNEVFEKLRHARVGISWRSAKFDQSAEYSTKVLEYGAAGCAVILNRTDSHEHLFGSDYPLYANSEEDFTKALRRALTDDSVVNSAAAKMTAVAKKHQMSLRQQELRNLLQGRRRARKPESRISVNQPLRVTVAGHDFKFVTPLIDKLQETGQFAFQYDKWTGHDKHDEPRSRALLDDSDVIFCEWALGNTVWYSKNVAPGQKVVARFHLQELETGHLKKADPSRIAKIVFVAQHVLESAHRKYSLASLQTGVIPNYTDPQKFFPQKKVAEARYTLGMVGFSPRRKRLDRAVDLLEALLDHDPRFALRIKGSNPFDYPWLRSRKEETVYYENLFRRINSSKRLRHKVIFDPPGDDVNDWFRFVGFILSPSDFESHHMAVGEGILTGAVPVVWDWEGSAQIWGEDSIVRTQDEALHRVLTGTPVDAEPFRSKQQMVGKDWAQLLLAQGER